jgi:tRNA A37 methylthiotransferase MiaB
LGGVAERNVAQKRVDAAISRQTEISDDKNQRMVGHIVQVLIEWVSMGEISC